MTDEDKAVAMAEAIYIRAASGFSDHTDKRQAASNAFSCAVEFYKYRNGVVTTELIRESIDPESK